MSSHDFEVGQEARKRRTRLLQSEDLQQISAFTSQRDQSSLETVVETPRSAAYLESSVFTPSQPSSSFDIMIQGLQGVFPSQAGYYPHQTTSILQAKPTREFLALKAQRRAIDEKAMNPPHQQRIIMPTLPPLSSPSTHTCSTNSLFRTLFHAVPFHKAVPTSFVGQNLELPGDRRFMLGSAVHPVNRMGDYRNPLEAQGESKTPPVPPNSSTPYGATAKKHACCDEFPSPAGTEEELKLPSEDVNEFFAFDSSALEPSVFREHEAPVDLIRQSSRAKQTPGHIALKSDKPGSVSISNERYDFWDLPPTMVPPSVMAGEHGQHYSSPPRKKTKRMNCAHETPQKVLEHILVAHGYGNSLRLSAAQGSIYETTPSALQLASFGKEVFKVVQQSDTEALSKLLEAGLSPNPCNQFRDSVLDLVCKRGNSQIFRCMVDHQADIRVCDNFGRTPLHHACWGNEFSEQIVYAILKRDWQQIVMEDKRGQTPLEYVHQDQYGEWVNFLQRHAAGLFPQGGRNIINVKEQRPYQQLNDPPHALPLPLACAVSAGEVTPADAVLKCGDLKNNEQNAL